MFRTRALSSIAVVAVGLIPVLLGDWILAVVWGTLFIIGYHEYRIMVGLRASAPVSAGYALVFAASVLPVLYDRNTALPFLVTVAILVPVAAGVFMHGTGIVEHVAMTTLGVLLFAMPAFAANSLRELRLGDRAGWIDSIASASPGAPDVSGRGLAWVLIALFVTWLSDTAAYLVGRRWGRSKLFPRVSPNKTVEGAIAGLLAAAITALVCTTAFRLDLDPVTALGIGVLLGGAGMLGDLSESMIKRQHGVKDSGALIPGHGGMYDRIDALLVVLVVTWVIASSTQG